MLMNEPVALMTEYGIKPLYEGALQEGMFLYTHPADLTGAVGSLSDEEILKMASNKFHYSEYRLVIDFARAILKKASEK
jgi:hypothetical protein